MNTFWQVLIFIGFCGLGTALMAGLFIGLCMGLDRWIGLSDVKRSDDTEQVRIVLKADASKFVEGMNAVGRAVQRKDP